MIFKNRLIRIAIAFMIVFMVTGCSNIGSSDEQDVASVITKVTGQVGKGKALAGTIEIYSADGKLVGNSYISNGKYSVDVKDYVGNVKVVANITKYHDEKSGRDINTNPFTLSAVSFIFEKAQPIKTNVTLMTDIVAKLIPDILTKTNAQIIEANKYVAAKLGIGSEYDLTTSDIVYLNVKIVFNLIQHK
jgi:hypothetical protein